MTTESSITAYDFDCVDLLGNNLPLRRYAGQPLLIVNTASLCSFSSQYRHLEEIWRRHRGDGLLILGMPSNDFGQQEPGNSAAIAALCTLKFGVTFPLLDKAHVTGEAAHPLFKWLAREGGFMARPRWNFYKYVIGRDGHLKGWFSCLTSPATGRFNRVVEQVVGKG